MDHICPICNGLEEIRVACDRCGCTLEDKGRLMDYFDDYSAYLEIDGTKKVDGFNTDISNNQCPHTLTCPNCGSNSIMLVGEW
ncbi:hypothetical protein BTR23_15205 [Alkalihalophilus pseudofirmus]|uniref:hypothetical protein n=1 Tax=Alkalihalobacterium alkalinitrilicum TaxID=427920 RepID=UPI00094D3B91|nr:hypothetical protein [Alkalihalobacterium alkalinitrilicum]OLO36416.1 hypothetical protein BTR23_15205 [Alkalihalophilus pseudofirmus]